MNAEEQHHPDGETLDDTSSRVSDSLPRDITSPQAKLVYLYLQLSNGATLAELEETLALKKITILSILDSLAERNLVERTESAYTVARS